MAERMNQGDMSKVSQFVMDDGKKAYRIIKIIRKINEHTANLSEDYSSIYNATLNVKKQEKIAAWVNKKIPITYIKIDDFSECGILDKWKK